MTANHIYFMPTRNFSTSDKAYTNIRLTLYSVQCVYEVVYSVYIISSHDTRVGYSMEGMVWVCAWWLLPHVLVLIRAR